MATALLFGKLPAHGDFVSRGIAAAERDALDNWLAASIADARAALGDGFDPTYDLAQPWRFSWDGADGWTAGAMAPSVDAVGRRYPILVASRGLEADRVAAAADRAEALIYEALLGGWTADRLFEAAATPPDAGEVWTSPAGWWTVGEDGTASATLPGDRPPALMRAVLTSGGAGGVAGQEGGR